MKISMRRSQTHLLSLFVILALFFGALVSHAETAPEERPVSKYFPTVVQRDITLWSDGTQLSGVLLYPKDRKDGEKLPAIVMCNGWGGTKAFLMESGIAPWFASAGYVVINYDYRGWNDSNSRLVFRGKMPKPGKDGNVTLTAQAIREVVDPFDQQEDIDAAISYVYGEPMVDKDRIGIWGTSFGGGHVIYRAAHDRRIKCVVAQVGAMPDDWTNAYPAGMAGIYKMKSDRARGAIDPVPQGESAGGGLTGSPYQERVSTFNPGQYADRVRVPTLIVDAEREHFFKISDNGGRAHQILKKNGVPTAYHVLKGIRHFDIYRGKPLQDAMALEIPWFDKYLKGKE